MFYEYQNDTTMYIVQAPPQSPVYIISGGEFDHGVEF